MERAMNSTEIAFHRERIAEISGIARAGQEWLVGLGAAALLIVLLIVLLAYNLYRVIQQQQIAEAAEASARESNRLKSEFIATMSHELRTPLNGVIGYADFLMTSAKGTLTEKQVDYLNRILSNGERLLRLVDDILDVSRIEADRIELLQSPYAPEELLASLRPDLQTLASAKGIELRTHYDPALPEEMIGDRHRLGQIVTNLVGNAVKFTDTGFIEVRFERKKADRWQITVSDSGIGIPAHAQTYIFERFRQVDGSLERKQGGVGLGLHIVRNLVILMGGTVSVESETNQGSTFRVELPVVVTEGVPTA
jgi:signal transduction histidine kinase